MEISTSTENAHTQGRTQIQDEILAPRKLVSIFSFNSVSPKFYPQSAPKSL